MIGHEVSAEELRSVFADLPADDMLVPNAVGNLAIYRRGTYVGWIDLVKDAHGESRVNWIEW